MKFDFRTREGLHNLLNAIGAVIMLLAATYFHWDQPAPSPLPNVTIVAEEMPVAGDGISAPDYQLTATGFATRQQADQAAQRITAPSDTAAPGPVTGFSIGFLLALLNLVAQYFGPFKS